MAQVIALAYLSRVKKKKKGSPRRKTRLANVILRLKKCVLLINAHITTIIIIHRRFRLVLPWPLYEGRIRPYCDSIWYFRMLLWKFKNKNKNKNPDFGCQITVDAIWTDYRLINIVRSSAVLFHFRFVTLLLSYNILCVYMALLRFVVLHL